ncbi:hypothetical protein ACFFX1_16185 [Dactylosporangium sucinum]|uniref:Transmembrane transport protein n=1 Tax=Dactylosporangium sucinum TaxID=1424081 RepID=A0A917TKP9_9ACTN|nr:hypothetical protein [Dactylosporangium sucinum]GGM27057.1 hypothetical protein GCM10007977_030320 [Dactylosporangium sucinum]
MTPEEVLARIEAPLSLRKRVGYLILALAGLTGSALIGLLWATEPGLPPRTKVAFAVLMTIGLCWAAFGGWAVTRRMPLLARDRVVAGWLGVAAWVVFTLGALVITTLRHKLEPSLLGIVLTLGVLAAVNLRAARRARSALVRRKAELTGRNSGQ